MIPYIFLEKNLFNSIELWLYNNHNDYIHTDPNDKLIWKVNLM